MSNWQENEWICAQVGLCAILSQLQRQDLLEVETDIKSQWQPCVKLALELVASGDLERANSEFNCFAGSLADAVEMLVSEAPSRFRLSREPGIGEELSIITEDALIMGSVVLATDLVQEDVFWTPWQKLVGADSGSGAFSYRPVNVIELERVK